ncbi:hypothetical protein PLESTF_001183900, partial [Pleodorina starrii]
THTCKANTANVPYLLDKIQITTGKDIYGNPTVGMCTTVYSQPCVNPNTTCCGMDFTK